MSKLLDDLKEYFENTHPEELEKDWEKIKEWNDVGPKVEDYIKFIEEVKNGK